MNGNDLKGKIIYLDYNATTPLDPAVALTMRQFLDGNYGNPSSSHPIGLSARAFVKKARCQVAEMLGCSEREITFTSGGTESNNLAIIGAALANQGRGNHIITTKIEHPAVLEVCAYLENKEFSVSYLDVDELGRIDPAKIERALTPSTILISVMHANNEVGTIQPLEEISKIAHRHNILLHTDAAQSIGKIPVSVDSLGVDLLSLAGHKLYAPKGIGTLYVKEGTKIQKIIYGASQENNLRPGTENVMSIAGLGTACELINENLEEYSKQMKKFRDLLARDLKKVFPWMVINGDLQWGIPNTLSASFPDKKSDLILERMPGVAASAGAASHSDEVKISHVLQAMRIPPRIAMGTIRFSVGRFSTEEEIERALPQILSAIEKEPNIIQI